MHLDEFSRERMQALPRWQQVMFTFSWYLLFPILWLLMRIGPSIAYPLARGIGNLVWLLSPKHRAKAVRNLEIAFGAELSDSERERIARASFRHFGYSFMDALMVPHLAAQGLDDVTLGPTDRLMELMRIHRASPSSAFHIGHFGSWEVGCAMAGMIGLPLHLVYRPIDHPYLDTLVRRMRSWFGQHTHARKGALQGYRHALSSGEVLGVIADQNGGDFAAFVPFFRTLASTEVSYFPLYRRYKTRAFFVAMVREGESFRFRILGPWLAPQDKWRDLDAHEEAMRMGRWYMECLERAIREAPEQYLWVHSRYKSRPGREGPSLYADLGLPLDEAILVQRGNTPLLPVSWQRKERGAS